jgi:tetratricopeptide (TPR) repeat protein
VWICDGCVRVCYEILEQIAAARGPSPPPADAEGADPAGADAVMAAIARAQQAALSGQREQARASFQALWDQLGPDGDPMHQVTLAHYMADVQTDPELELDWDQRALAAADRVTDERAKSYHPSMEVRGFYASLYANLAADYERLGRSDEARRHLDLARAAIADLPEGGYGDLVRTSIDDLATRLLP